MRFFFQKYVIHFQRQSGIVIAGWLSSATTTTEITTESIISFENKLSVNKCVGSIYDAVFAHLLLCLNQLNVQATCCV